MQLVTTRTTHTTPPVPHQHGLMPMRVVRYVRLVPDALDTRHHNQMNALETSTVTKARNSALFAPAVAKLRVANGITSTNANAMQDTREQSRQKMTTHNAQYAWQAHTKRLLERAVRRLWGRKILQCDSQHNRNQLC